MSKHTSTDEKLDQAMNEMSVLCEFPNDRDYCADMAGQVRSFPITQDCRKAIKAYIKTNYILKADVVEAIPKKKEVHPDLIGINEDGVGQYELEKIAYNQAIDDILESLNLEGAQDGQ